MTESESSSSSEESSFYIATPREAPRKIPWKRSKSDRSTILQRRTSDRRPLWEPPVLDYSHLIDTEHSQAYTKRLEAVMNYTKGDVVRATQIMDYTNERGLLDNYLGWAASQAIVAKDKGENLFFNSLLDELQEELRDVNKEIPETNSGKFWDWGQTYTFIRKEDGPWVLRTPTTFSEVGNAAPASTASEEESSAIERHHIWAAEERMEEDASYSHIATVATPTSVSLNPTTTLSPGLHLNLNLNFSQALTSHFPSSQLAHRLVSLLNKEDDDVD